MEPNHLFYSPWDLKFERWPENIIGYLFYATSSFVHHFVAFCEFKLELQSETLNTVKDVDFSARVT